MSLCTVVSLVCLFLLFITARVRLVSQAIYIVCIFLGGISQLCYLYFNFPPPGCVKSLLFVYIWVFMVKSFTSFPNIYIRPSIPKFAAMPPQRRRGKCTHLFIYFTCLLIHISLIFYFSSRHSWAPHYPGFALRSSPPTYSSASTSCSLS